METAARDGRIPALDGLRGCAILLVILFHYGGEYRVPWFDFGWCGVDLFFVLSGYLITGNLLATKGDRRYFFNFYGRRTLRIFPLYYAFIVVVLFVFPHLRMIGDEQLLPSAPWFFLYAVNIHYGLHGWSTSLSLDPLWSLCIEEQFYLVWPTVVSLCTPRRLFSTCIALAALVLLVRVGLVAVHASPIMIYVLPRMDSLIIGAALAAAMECGYDRAKLSRLAERAVKACGGVLLALLLIHAGMRLANEAHPKSFARAVMPWSEFGVFMQTIGFTLLAVFFAATLVLSLDEQRAWSRFLRIRPLRALGRYSYSLYLFHLPVLVLVARALYGKFAWSPKHTAIIAFFVSVAASWLSWQLFEKQFLKLKAYFAGDSHVTS